MNQTPAERAREIVAACSEECPDHSVNVNVAKLIAAITAALTIPANHIRTPEGNTIGPVQAALLKRLDEAGARGLDGSPGDDLAAEAASHIRVQNSIISVLQQNSLTSTPTP